MEFPSKVQDFQVMNSFMNDIKQDILIGNDDLWYTQFIPSEFLMKYPGCILITGGEIQGIQYYGRQTSYRGFSLLYFYRLIV